MSNQETYGLSFSDLNSAINKISKQKSYLENQTFLSASGDEKSLLDVSYSANLSERYYSRILNKVDTFVSTSMSRNLIPVFLTITLDGFFRDLLKGDYTRYTKEVAEKYKRYIPNNKTFGMYRDYLEKGNTLTSKDLYKILGYQLNSFWKNETLRDIKKNDLTYSAIRVTEPHKDGVPHFHILMYVPEQYVPRLYKEFMRFFPAPRNHVKLTKKNTRKSSMPRNGHYICDMFQVRNGKKEIVKMYETHGFQTQIRSAAGYILKYILKSFKNLIDGDELDYLQAWYVHNKIPRIITTHTLVSQEVYHKTSMMEDDWHYLTDIKKNGGFIQDRLNNYFKFDDGLGRKILFDNGLYMLSNQGKIITLYGEKFYHKKKILLRSLDFSIYGDLRPPTYNILNQYEIVLPHKEYQYFIKNQSKYDNSCAWLAPDGFHSFIFDVHDFSNYIPIEDKLLLGMDSMPTILEFKPLVKYSDLELYNHYTSFDFDKYTSMRYRFVHNELIDRGLLKANYLSEDDVCFEFTPDWAVFDKNEYLKKEGSVLVDYDVKPIAVKNMKDEWLKIEFDFYRSVDIFQNDVYLRRYGQLFNEIQNRGLKYEFK